MFGLVNQSAIQFLQIVELVQSGLGYSVPLIFNWFVPNPYCSNDNQGCTGNCTHNKQKDVRVKFGTRTLSMTTRMLSTEAGNA